MAIQLHLFPEKRLFVNLCSEPFLDFQQHGKAYEVRNYEGVFTEREVYAGRRVELRKAWNRGSLWGYIGNVVAGSLEDIFSQVDFRKIMPRALLREEAIEQCRAYLNADGRYIAFEVRLDG